MTGIRSLDSNLCPQLKQWEGGETMDFPRGTRSATTFRKLPTLIPRRKKITASATSTGSLPSGYCGTLIVALSILTICCAAV